MLFRSLLDMVIVGSLDCCVKKGRAVTGEIVVDALTLANVVEAKRTNGLEPGTSDTGIHLALTRRQNFHGESGE